MDRLNINSQIEHLQSKYVGTGHADTIKHEWVANQYRDSLASFVGHNSLLSYISVAENETKARAKMNMLEKMLQPCGPPPEKEDQ
ncbi:splicing factor 3B subunit 5/RDS3 complex subunit 10 [Choanephora cucurbitarum]|uniref:Splicing factor subunit n=1 Tax=Choanephora cucurbitarum TaxID=101091 RepID=A0A1C7ND19_9FUNG|nr:splicing factor 3B subunit 5/RDS3 complex subunit 10 [Choanephora cucurbitarum]OBZ86997.1 putative splicing factor 3B subunit 5 [Choanephora cucurbitarum]